MKLDTKRNIDSNVFTTDILFKEYGSQALTAEQEKAILEDFPVLLSYKNLSFKGRFQLVGNTICEVIDSLATTPVGNTVVGDPLVDGTPIAIALNNVEIAVDENFHVTYKVDVKSIADTEVNTVLTSKELVCEAKCTLFENRIKSEVYKLLNAVRGKVNGFESDTEETV
jgi:hypothetical protein